MKVSTTGELTKRDRSSSEVQVCDVIDNTTHLQVLKLSVHAPPVVLGASSSVDERHRNRKTSPRGVQPRFGAAAMPGDMHRQETLADVVTKSLVAFVAREAGALPSLSFTGH